MAEETAQNTKQKQNIDKTQIKHEPAAQRVPHALCGQEYGKWVLSSQNVTDPLRGAGSRHHRR